MALDEKIQDADVVISLAVAPKKKVWANRVHYFATESTLRTAGTLQTGSNAHSALAIALIAAVKSVSQVKLDKKKLADATIRIVTEDVQFGHACNLLASGLKVTGLRSSKQLLSPLFKSLKRGRIVVQVVAEGNTRVQSLKGWAVNSLTPEKEGRVSLRVFTPKLVSESGSLQDKAMG